MIRIDPETIPKQYLDDINSDNSDEDIFSQDDLHHTAVEMLMDSDIIQPHNSPRSSRRGGRSTMELRNLERKNYAAV